MATKKKPSSPKQSAPVLFEVESKAQTTAIHVEKVTKTYIGNSSIGINAMWEKYGGWSPNAFKNIVP